MTGKTSQFVQNYLRVGSGCLARCVVKYSDATNLNAIADSAACTALTQLLDCNVNNIESERLLVTNVFAVDDCGNLLLKMVADTSTMTDYNTECTELTSIVYATSGTLYSIT